MAKGALVQMRAQGLARLEEIRQDVEEASDLGCASFAYHRAHLKHRRKGLTGC
jgi:hypothetical protein